MKHSVQASASSRNKFGRGQYQCLLQNKLDGIRKHFSDKDIRKDVLDNMIRLLAKESFIELENEKTNTYKVLTSWHYLEKLVDSINIFEDIEDGKPE